MEERIALVAALLVVVVRLFLDIEMLSQGLVKLELGNALQLEQHQAIRHGFLVLMTGEGLSYEALHHWLLHLPMLFSPRPEAAAAFLVFVDFLTAWTWFRMIELRWGRAAGFAVAALYLATPVAPILSKHVIATAFVPLTAAYFADGLVRMGEGDERAGLGRALLAFGVLLWLNHWHIWLALPLLWVMGTLRLWKAPWWGWLGVTFGAGLPGVKLALTLDWTDFVATVGEHAGRHWADLEWVFRRMVFVEPNMTEMVPWLYGWPVLLCLLVAGLIWRWRARPAGLVPLLVLAPAFMVVTDVEATVVWQTGLFLLAAFAVWQVRWMALPCVVYAVVAQIWLAHTFLTYGPPPQQNFFSLSTVAQKEAILDVLEGEFDLRAAELDTLSISHPVGENGIPAPVPGLRNLAHISRDLPPGGDRCAAVGNEPISIPTGAQQVETAIQGGLHYAVWVGGECTTNLRYPLPKAWYLDLRKWKVTTTPSLPDHPGADR